jgi:hypothetical protein
VPERIFKELVSEDFSPVGIYADIQWKHIKEEKNLRAAREKKIHHMQWSANITLREFCCRNPVDQERMEWCIQNTEGKQSTNQEYFTQPNSLSKMKEK